MTSMKTPKRFVRHWEVLAARAPVAGLIRPRGFSRTFCNFNHRTAKHATKWRWGAATGCRETDRRC
jgi:hypothetical protein